MTSITTVKGIADHIRSLPTKQDKIDYLAYQSKAVIMFMSKNIRMDGIGKIIGSQIQIYPESLNTMEDIIRKFNIASQSTSKIYKTNVIQDIRLSKVDREFVIECLYGSLKLGVTIPIPDPKFSDIIRPALCGSGIEFDPESYIIEEKFDGIRCVAMNVNGKIKLYTRKGKPITAEIISSELLDSIPLGCVVDGELVSADGEFQNMRRHTEDIEYKVFDMIFHDHKSIAEIPLIQRRDILIDNLAEQEHIKVSKILNLNTIEDIHVWINKHNIEGIIAKKPESIYAYNDRKNWIKMKPFLDITGWITGWVEGKGKRSGGIGAVEFLPEGSQVTTMVGSGFNDNDLILVKNLLKDNKKIKITVKYQNLTTDGHLRFPTFLRMDKLV